MEVWKDIKGYEGIYQASNKGKIRTAPGKTTCNKKYEQRTWQVRELKGRGDAKTTGRRVTLWKGGKAKDFLVARLVAFTFYNQDINNHYLTVNHLDGNRLNNEISNLELVSLADNIRHGFKTGLYSNQKKCALVELYTGKKYEFSSLSKASEYLNKSTGYLSNIIKKGRNLVLANGTVYEVAL